MRVRRRKLLKSAASVTSSARLSSFHILGGREKWEEITGSLIIKLEHPTLT